MAATETNVGSVNLSWRQLSYTIADKKAPDGCKWILHPQNGAARAGDLLALMGPSGSGKTSLLNALAGRLPITKGAAFGGNLDVNGMSKDQLPCQFADISAYVEQEDVLFALSTVQETLDFAARLRLPARTSAVERNERIEEILRQLGLLHVRNTNVGGSSFNGALRGLSGGERKRLSIAIELLHKPCALFLDEPTTGLDSYQALNVMEKLRELANNGHTVVVSIHQPRSSIFAMFSGVYLLAAGRPVYTGPADAVIDYFDSLGFALPAKFNPADFLIDLVSIDQRDPDEQAKTEKQLEGLHSAWDSRATSFACEDVEVKGVMESTLAAMKKPAGQSAFFGPLVLLLRRGWREQMRDKLAICIKTVFQCFFTLIFGLVYFDMGRDQKSIQDRMGILFFLTMNQAFGAVIGCAQVIPRQLVVVNRERANRLYSIFPFYISSMLVMIPIEAFPQLVNNAIIFFITNLSGSFWVFFGVMLLENFVGISLGMLLSASFKNVQMASQLAPAVVILFLTFSGFLINENSVPVYFAWLKEISFIRYAFKAVAVNEMEDTSFECDTNNDAYCITSGNQVLAQLNFDEDGLILQSVAILCGMFALLNLIAVVVLLIRGPSFLRLTSADASKAPIESVPATPKTVAEVASAENVKDSPVAGC